MKLVKFRGVQISVNTILLGLISISIYYGYGRELFFLLVSLLLHELCHIAVLIFFRIRIKELEILPFGSVAKLEGLLEFEPRFEALVALAGPAASICIAILVFRFYGDPYLAAVNLTLGLVNLLPILPLDGGRILRAFLSQQLGFGRATLYTIRQSKALSGILVIAGFLACRQDYSLFLLVVIGCFTFRRAFFDSSLFGLVLMRYILSFRRTREKLGVMPVRFLSVHSGITLKSLAMYLAPNRYHIFYIVDDKPKIIGTITEAELIQSYINDGSFVTVGTILQRTSGKDSRHV